MRYFRRLFFSLWYYVRPPWDTGVTPPELEDFIQSHPPGRALDLGCGTGTNVITLAKHGWQAIGVDFARHAIRTARQKATKEHLEASFVLGDVTNLSGIHGPFDLVLDIGCFHGLNPKERQTYLANLDRVLAPGGSFLLYAMLRTPDKSDFGVSRAEIESLSNFLELERRQDGTNRGNRPSTWLTFRKRNAQ